MVRGSQPWDSGLVLHLGKTEEGLVFVLDRGSLRGLVWGWVERQFGQEIEKLAEVKTAIA